MINTNQRTFYIDLFDDGIPEKNLLTTNIDKSSVEKKLLDAARFQILLAILFERQVVVPESWAVSSPTFLRIFSEITETYPEVVGREDAAGIVKKAPLKPFVFSFFSPKNISPAMTYLTALVNRLKTDRRVQCLEGLGSKNKPFDKSARSHIADYLQEVTNKGEISNHKAFADGFRDAIYKGFDGFDDDKDESSIAFAISDVIKYLNNHRVILETKYWGSDDINTHKTVVQENVALIHAVLHHSTLAEIFPSQTNSFIDFFKEAQAKKIEFADVMGMWAILKNHDLEIRDTVEAFGRYALNRGYGKAVGSSHSALSFNYYCHGLPPSPFAFALLERVATAEQSSNSADLSFSSFIEISPAFNYDLDDTIDWKNAWKAAATLACSGAWKTKRTQIEEKFNKSQESNQEIPIEIWHDLFDDINSEFQDLAFHVIGGERPSVRLLKKIKSGFETVSDGAIAAGKTIEIASTMLGPLRFLIKKGEELIPTKKVLQGIREYRKIESKMDEIKFTKSATKLITSF